ncbi:hypothetical protein BLNAU_14256 [Blattamonas nauphoetae]|uniref:Uncharacterized protein n=1 Tax=Blattamonas nauphoetae TaxID=2049346 RepID=A0ABQ9XHP9_9EUKA|nr:hypothetical protein BLNAU_14256 [Blattamonas nauphoetae]
MSGTRWWDVHTLAHPSSLLPPSTSHTATQPHTRPPFLSPPSLHLSHRLSATHSPTLPLSSLPPPLTPPLSHTLAHPSSLLSLPVDYLCHIPIN